MRRCLRSVAIGLFIVASGSSSPGVAAAQEPDNAIFHYSLVDVDVARMEGVAAGRWDASGWIGTDFDRLWWSTSGETMESEVEGADVQLLYGRYVRRFWDLVVGYRQDIRPVSQGYLTFGVMGLAPYWFEVSVLGSISGGGTPRLEIEAENDLYVTQRLVMTLEGAIDWIITDDDTLDLSAGVGAVEAGIRTRYEIRRKFAPYLDLTWERTPELRSIESQIGAASGFRLGVGLRLIY